METMRYVLTPAEKTFKDAVREFARRSAPAPEPGAGGGASSREDISNGMVRELARWLAAVRPDGLSRVEEVMALEELARRSPASGTGIAATGPFQSLSPGLRRAAADLGAAQGLLAPGLTATADPFGAGFRNRTLSQEMADLLTGIEAARLKLYRAAILEDTGRGDEQETAAAARLARDLISRTVSMIGESERREG
jgi:alkylation response protein AidB-like acyl-CoA dehydrogenase